VLRWRDGAYVSEDFRGAAAGPVEDGPALLFDADGNGTRELLVTKAGAEASAWPDGFRPVLYANDGHGNFTATDALPPVGINVGAACAADVDGDGRLDVFLGGRSIPGRYPEAAASVLLRNVGGRFVDISEGTPSLRQLGLVKSAVFADVDLDGRPDLVVALEWNCVRYLHNEGAGRFSDWTEKVGFASGGHGWWNGIATADFNGDGRPDFAIGNLGLNTTYRASAAQPATLFYGDFAQNGTAMAMEGTYDGDRLFPVRSRTDLGARLPFVLRKFPKNDDFARADLARIFGDETLKQATRYIADNFSSGVFLSQRDGTYRFQPFPRVAQIGPIPGIVAGDFDGDGQPDVGALQNADIAVPRFDGGVGIMLAGTGEGDFRPVAAAESGVVVPGNGRALVVLDPTGTGRPGLFGTRQSGPSIYLQASGSDRRWVSIRLRGDGGNADGIGAKIELMYANGRVTHHEISLGGGWLSQSAPVVRAAALAGNPIVKARVTWPGGKVTEHTHAPESGNWILGIGEPSH
jgi:hypothetical protein